MGIAAGVVPDVKDQGSGPLYPEGFNGRDGFVGAPGVEIGDGDEPDAVIQQLACYHIGEDFCPLDVEFQLLLAPDHHQMDGGAFLSPDDISQLLHGKSFHALPVGGDDPVVHLKACFPGGAVFLHSHDPEAHFLLVGDDGDADAHVGVLLLLQQGVIVLRGDIVAPPVAQGGDHGRSRIVLHDLGVGLPDEALGNQLLQLPQLSGRGAEEGENAHGCGEAHQKYQHIGENVKQFFHRDIPRNPELPTAKTAVGKSLTGLQPVNKAQHSCRDSHRRRCRRCRSAGGCRWQRRFCPHSR